jgi:hypothetical protein
MNHAFTLEVLGIDPTRDGYEDTLFDAGCDDALIAVIDNTLYLDFDRDAPSFEAAVESARRDVERAGGRIVRMTPAPE